MKKLLLALFAVAGFTVADLSARDCGACKRKEAPCETEVIRTESPRVACSHTVQVADCPLSKKTRQITEHTEHFCPPNATEVVQIEE